MTWYWKWVHPQPDQLHNEVRYNEDIAKLLLLRWAELQKVVGQEREQRKQAEERLAEVAREGALWEDRYRLEVDRRGELENEVGQEREHRKQVEERLVVVAREGALWEDSYRLEVGRRGELEKEVGQEREHRKLLRHAFCALFLCLFLAYTVNSCVVSPIFILFYFILF